MGKKKAVKHKTSKKTFKKITAQRIIAPVLQKVKETLPERVEVHVVKKTLGKAPEEYHFVLHDGRKLKSLYEYCSQTPK